MSELRVISLGWGVQSWTMAAMVALGDLPPVDFAIHSDTTHEKEATYAFRRQWEKWLVERGVQVETVTPTNGATFLEPSKTGTTNVYVPVYTASSNKGGQLNRQCTDKWKIRPMKKHVSKVLKQRSLAKSPGIVDMWLGITLDEWERMRPSKVKYINNVYPLVDKRMTRGDCIAWLDRQGLPVPPKSACYFCPYQNNYRWQEMKQANGEDWQAALATDAEIRDKRPPFALYLHRTRQPLEQAVKIPEDYGNSQLSIFDVLDDENGQCTSGHCFL